MTGIFGTIYIIRNIINNKVYVGQTTRTLNKRIHEYKRAYNKKILYNQYLLNAFKKYSWENFEFLAIDTANDIDKLNEKEIFYINQYKSNNRKCGYNISSGGKNAIPNTETLKKMSEAHLGIKQGEEWKNNRIAKAGTDDAKKYGKIKTEEEKTYLSINSPKYWLGKNRDEKTKLKISDTKQKNGISQKQIEVACRMVYKINPQTNDIIDTFISTIEASKGENVHQSTISRWCSNNKIINNILWTYNKYKQ